MEMIGDIFGTLTNSVCNLLMVCGDVRCHCWCIGCVVSNLSGITPRWKL